jgi:hypothetical protein
VYDWQWLQCCKGQSQSVSGCLYKIFGYLYVRHLADMAAACMLEIGHPNSKDVRTYINMCVCMYVCVYVFMYVCMHVDVVQPDRCTSTVTADPDTPRSKDLPAPFCLHYWSLNMHVHTPPCPSPCAAALSSWIP